MTTHSWGESALGSWKLEIQNDGVSGKLLSGSYLTDLTRTVRLSDATLFKWELVLYGTSVHVGPFGGLDGGSGVTNNHVQRSEGSLWSAPGSGGAVSSMLPANCCLSTPFGLCAGSLILLYYYVFNH